MYQAIKVCAVGLILLLVLCLNIPTKANSGELLSLSFPKLRLSDNERVASFKILIREGRIYSVPHFPMGWDIGIVNELSWTANISGSCILTTALLSPDWFREFLVIERRSKEGFDIEVEIGTFTYVSEKQNTIRLRMGDLLLKGKGSSNVK